jgi:hypothetical protein
MDTIKSKFYVLYNPIFGYLGGNKIRSRFSDDIEYARKFNQRNHAASCMKQKFRSPEWEVREIIYLGFETTVK